MKIQIKKNPELLAAIMCFLPAWNYYVAALLSSYNLPTITGPIYAIIGFLALVAYLWVAKIPKCLGCIVALVFLLALSYLINPATGAEMLHAPLFSSSAVSLLLYYFPPFLLLMSQCDLKLFHKYYARLSLINIITAILSFANYVLIQKVIILPEYMAFAYWMLPSIFVCFTEGVARNKWMFVFSTAGSILILIGGCRGAFVTLMVFYALCLILLSPTKKTVKGFIVKGLLIAFAIVVLINLNNIMLLSERALITFGYQSRTLGFVSELDKTPISVLFGDDGRIEIWEIGFNNLSFAVKGLFGDRTILSEGTLSTGVYSHNWILELLIDFGLFFGLIAVAVILYMIIKSFVISLKSQTILYQGWGIAMFSILMVKHMISASFLTSFDFWIYFGVCCLLLQLKGNQVDEKSYVSSITPDPNAQLQ